MFHFLPSILLQNIYNYLLLRHRFHNNLINIIIRRRHSNFTSYATGLWFLSTVCHLDLLILTTPIIYCTHPRISHTFTMASRVESILLNPRYHTVLSLLKAFRNGLAWVAISFIAASVISMSSLTQIRCENQITSLTCDDLSLPRRKVGMVTSILSYYLV